MKYQPSVKSTCEHICSAFVQAKTTLLTAILTLAAATNSVQASDQSKDLPTSGSSALNSAEELVLKSHQFVADASSVEIIQTEVDTMKPIVNGKPANDGMITTNTSVIRVLNGEPMTVELTTREPSGRELRVLRRGDHVVMKLGPEPWKVPSGEYAKLKEQMAQPFACPLPHGGSNSPRWKVSSAGVEQGEECDIVETVGDSVLDYVRGRINAGFAEMFPDPATRPTISVQSYKSRHWIQRTLGKRLRVEQSGHMRMSMRQPGGVVEMAMETATTAVYQNYGKVDIKIPTEALRLFAESDGQP
jgi:hypothetical protein